MLVFQDMQLLPIHFETEALENVQADPYDTQRRPLIFAQL